MGYAAVNKRQRKKMEKPASLRREFRDWKRGKTKLRITRWMANEMTTRFETYHQSMERIRKPC